MVEIIPVLDIRGGVAVSGRSGRREEYRPLRTVFHSEPNPVEIARRLPFERLYVADLDGIERGRPDLETLSRLSRLRRVLIDLGVRVEEDLEWYEALDCDVVLGTETLATPAVLSKAVERLGERLVVSIDLKDDRVVSPFLPGQPLEAYRCVVGAGVRHVLFLNISAVGTGKASFPFIKDLNKTSKILLGGGIAEEDIQSLSCFADALLIGTALHRGLLDVSAWRS